MSATVHTHGAVHAARYPRLYINRLGFWLFLFSESMLFAGLLASRFYLQGIQRPHELSQSLGLGITVILLLSSLTAYLSETYITYGDRPRFLRYTLATMALGTLFLVGVGFEWYAAFQHFPPWTPFGTVFFSMTGMHAFHVLSGVFLLALIYYNGRRGAYGPEDAWPPEAVVKYWHFVDVVWVFFYAALYLVA